MRFLVVFSVLFALCAAAPKNKRSTILVSEAADPVLVSPSFYNLPAVAGAYYTSPVVETVPVVSSVKSVVGPVETNYVGGSAVSHQSRVDVKSYPSVVSEYVAPAVVETVPSVVDARSVYLTPTLYHDAPAVSQQSRVDIKSSPAVVSHQVVSPAVFGVNPVHQIYAL